MEEKKQGFWFIANMNNGGGGGGETPALPYDFSVLSFSYWDQEGDYHTLTAENVELTSDASCEGTIKENGKHFYMSVESDIETGIYYISFQIEDEEIYLTSIGVCYSYNNDEIFTGKAIQQLLSKMEEYQ